MNGKEWQNKEITKINKTAAFLEKYGCEVVLGEYDLRDVVMVRLSKETFPFQITTEASAQATGCGGSRSRFEVMVRIKQDPLYTYYEFQIDTAQQNIEAIKYLLKMPEFIRLKLAVELQEEKKNALRWAVDEKDPEEDAWLKSEPSLKAKITHINQMIEALKNGKLA